MPTESERNVSSNRLWFGFAAAVTAWIVTGLTDVLITWRACFHRDRSGAEQFASGDLAGTAIITLILLSVALTSGVVSYRNWRSLSRGKAQFSSAQGSSRQEFMAIAGTYISFTLGVGIVWFGLPLAILDYCVRTR